jgi:hypothetical protein
MEAEISSGLGGVIGAGLGPAVAKGEMWMFSVAGGTATAFFSDVASLSANDNAGAQSSIITSVGIRIECITVPFLYSEIKRMKVLSRRDSIFQPRIVRLGGLPWVRE